MEAKQSAQHPSGLSVAVALGSLLTAVVVGAINVKLLPPAAFWVCAVAFLIVAVLFLLPWFKSARARISLWRVQRQIRSHYRLRIVALCNALRPLSEQSVTYSVGSILNAAINHELLSVPTVIAYQTALGTLFDRVQELQQLAPHISDTHLMARIHSWLQAYIRICDGVGGQIKSGMKSAETQPGIKRLASTRLG